MNKNFLVKLISGTVALTTMLNIALGAPPAMASPFFDPFSRFYSDQSDQEESNKVNPSILDPFFTQPDEDIFNGMNDEELKCIFGTNDNLAPPSQQHTQEWEYYSYSAFPSDDDDTDFNNEVTENDESTQLQTLVNKHGAQSRLEFYPRDHNRRRYEEDDYFPKNKGEAKKFTSKAKEIKKAFADIIYGRKNKTIVSKNLGYKILMLTRELKDKPEFRQCLLEEFGGDENKLNNQLKKIKNPKRDMQRLSSCLFNYFAQNSKFWIAVVETLMCLDLLPEVNNQPANEH